MQRSGIIRWDWKAAKSRTEAGATEQQRGDDAKLRTLRFCEKGKELLPSAVVMMKPGSQQGSGSTALAFILSELGRFTDNSLLSRSVCLNSCKHLLLDCMELTLSTG